MKHIRKLVMLLALMAPVTVWGQTDYSGVYYIGSVGFVAGNTTTNYYLCPTEGWCYYKATNDFSSEDTEMPFLTTYTCRAGSYDSTKAVWIVKKHASEDYYYIIQAKTGRYLMANGQIRTSSNADRMRVHLEEVADPSNLDDTALFAITPYNNTYLVISAKSSGGWNGDNHKWFTVNGGNTDYLVGRPTKTGGPKEGSKDYSNTTGIVGIYEQKDGNAQFYLDTVVRKPVITQAANGDITITCATGSTTIYYTLDDSDPVVPADGTTDPTDPNTYKYSTSFSPAIGSTGVKAVAVLANMHAAVSKKAELSFSAYTTPIITFNNTTNEASISSEGTVYYTTNGEDPAVDPSSLIYSDPFTITSTTTVKAIAIHSGYLTSDIATTTIDKVATPVITPLTDGTVEITCATPGATIHYEMGASPSNPTTTSTTYTDPINGAAGKVIKAFAAKEGWINSEVETSETIVFTCATPVISKTDATHFTITCSFPISGVSIYFTTNGDTPTASSTLYEGTVSFSESDLPMTVKAIAVATDYNNSAVATKTILTRLDLDNEDNFYIIATNDDFNKFIMMVNAEGAGYNYKITNDITVPSGSDPITEPFTGVLKGVAKADGTLPVISGLNHALINTLDGGTVKNLVLDNVTISGGTNVGAICNEATGDSRIYNCGVLATSSTVTTDDDGYTKITSCSSTVGGSNYVGGLVGLLDVTSRVINCFSYANITSGAEVGGIVGHNNVATTSNNLKTMVMNCMFYGDIDTNNCTSKAPIYNGEIITNDGDANGVNNYNYFWSGATYVQDRRIDVYHCALGAETRFLQRFEFFRPVLNSNRALAAWWVNSTSPDTSEIMKWVMEPDNIGTSTPYPILKKWGKYPSVVNYTPGETDYDYANRNKGRKLGTLTVTIEMGTNSPYAAPSDASITNSDTILTITDKDFEHFNFNYGKVQLPYYNEVGTKNYTGNRVVTGWKITSISGGTKGSYSTGADVTYTDGELTATPYNFADRTTWAKDYYGTGGSNRVFNQGAYWDVPDGVTAITIQPYWGKAVYLSDAYWDVVYQNGTEGGTGTGSTRDAMTTAANVPNVGGGVRYENGVSTFNGQVVYTSMGNAITSSGTGMALFQGVTGSPSSQTVYDYAVVLVGNYHHNGSIESGEGKPYTVTSVDLDGDNEPDYSLMLRFNARTGFHPARYDFLNMIGLGMAQKSTGGTGTYNFAIIQPKYWFEVTNTALFRVTQFEYSPGTRSKKPIILQGGVVEQWVTQQQDAGDRVSYFHVGGNVWFKEFHRGSHQDNKEKSTPHPPLSVTGGDYDEFYLTGLYQSQATTYDDNAECYIDGGRFGIVAGAGMEGIGTTEGKGNITWIIDHADINEFYGGGINFAKPVFGNIHTIIRNSYVYQFCGGPKFGNMESGRTVTTVADNCHFVLFFGAGYGGNSYNRYAPANRNNVINLPGPGKLGSSNAIVNLNSWNDWVDAEYKQTYNATYEGVSTQINYQFIPHSSNVDNVARLWVEFVGFSLATTNNVTSTLTNCTIDSNFYGGGSLGKVDGTVSSVLDSCIVKGNVFGAGYSATKPIVAVMNRTGFLTEPHYDEQSGTFLDHVFPDTVHYHWEEAAGLVNSTQTAINTGTKTLYTTEDLDALGVVNTATLIIKGNSEIGTMQGEPGSQTLKPGTGNVYGGGDQSAVSGSTTVILKEGATVLGNVYGGGNQGAVGGSSEVKIQ